MSLKRRPLTAILGYGLAWLLLAGFAALAGRLWGIHVQPWLVTTLVIAGAMADWFTGWLRRRR